MDCLVQRQRFLAVNHFASGQVSVGVHARYACAQAVELQPKIVAPGRPPLANVLGPRKVRSKCFPAPPPAPPLAWNAHAQTPSHPPPLPLPPALPSPVTSTALSRPPPLSHPRG